ncbi:MAG: PaaI family thioesterase [Acidobacteria bacterium]|nr:PaaI family thioesterase [Acidobacteriota bacterium]
MNHHFRKLENMYHAAPVNSHYLPKMEVGDGRAVITMDVDPGFFHAAGALHGSVYFKGLDDAAFFAVNSLVEDVFVLTVSFNIFLLRPVTEGCLRAEGFVTSRSKNLFVAEAVLYADDKRQVARGSGSFMRSRIRLEEVESYN